MGLPFEVVGLDHVVLRVADLDRAIAFYGDVLGCPVERRLDELGLVQLRAGDALVDLVGINTPLGPSGTSEESKLTDLTILKGWGQK